MTKPDVNAGSTCFLLAASLLGLGFTANARAQNAAAANTAWNSAFLVQNSGNTYYANEEKSAGITIAHLYTGALDIAVAEDVYQQTHSQSQRNLIISLLNTFLEDNVMTSAGTMPGNGVNWNYDGYDDDLGWMTNAVLRGYQYTGVAQYLTVAENNWNIDYNRGWMASLGGGVEENVSQGYANPQREALSNDNLVFTGVTLYQITGDSTYLTKAENIYAWVRANLFNATNSQNSLGMPGQVNEGIFDSSGAVNPSDNVYNEGSFLTAATALYRITGKQEYYNDAQLVINHVTSEQPILHDNHEACGCQWAYWFTNGLSQFSTVANLWSQYLPYLQNNATIAWSKRNSNNLTWNDWTTQTSDSVTAGSNGGAGTPDEVEMESAVAIWQHLPPPSANLSGSYEIQNVASGLAVQVQTSSTASVKPIVQDTFSSASNQLWTFVPTSGGYYHIQNVNTGQVMNASGLTAKSGEPIVQYPAAGIIPGNDQWMPVQNPDATYSFFNLNSLQALDDPGESTQPGLQLDQYFGNSTSAQSFRLIAQ